MDEQVVFTIVTPTIGRQSLLGLKEVLRREKVPYLHLIMWDGKRCENALDPADLEDERTFCYVMRHPTYPEPNARMDVWLRAVGATIARTPYITFADDDTWPEDNHLETVLEFLTRNDLDYTFVKRRMWTREGECLGIDDFEATGELNAFGYTLIDNSSLFVNQAAARVVSQVFLDNPVYGDDRITHGPLKQHCKGKKLNSVLINHRCQPNLVDAFRKYCTPEKTQSV